MCENKNYPMPLPHPFPSASASILYALLNHVPEVNHNRYEWLLEESKTLEDDAMDDDKDEGDACGDFNDDEYVEEAEDEFLTIPAVCSFCRL